MLKIPQQQITHVANMFNMFHVLSLVNNLLVAQFSIDETQYSIISMTPATV